MNSRICFGKVRHRHFVTKKNQFSYKLYMMLLDLDELDTLFKPYWLWSVNRFNVAYFQRKYYLGDRNISLRKSVANLIQERFNDTINQVFLLTNLSFFGYCINPVSVYFCMKNTVLKYIILEVTNTPWKEKHFYILQPKKIKMDSYSDTFDKVLHVSPFLTMDYQYQLNCKYTKDKIILHINNLKNDQRHFDATLSLNCKPINHYNLAKALLRYPAMTLKVFFGIHWQALKLWLKGFAVIKHKGFNDDR